MPRITSWSFSRYSTYKICPQKLRFSAIAKILEPPHPSMQRGSDIHKLAEQFITGAIPTLPSELAEFAKLFQDLRHRYTKNPAEVIVESQWAFTRDWALTAWDDWQNCYIRVKVDVAYFEGPSHMVVIDWKTGKFRYNQNAEYTEQLELYALSALLQYPELETVETKLVYLDQAVVYPWNGSENVYTRDDAARLKATWEQRTAAMMDDNDLAPRKNWLCKYCFYRKANAANGGGQCQY